MPPRKRLRRKLAAAEAEKKTDWELGMEGAAGGEETTEASPTVIPETQSFPIPPETETQEDETQEAERLEAERLEAMIMEAEPEEEETQEDTEVSDILLSQKGKSKRGKPRSILFSDEDEEAIVDFLKDHEWLYNKRHPLYKGHTEKGGAVG